MWWTAISFAFKSLKGLKTYWYYIGAAILLILAVTYHLITVNTLKGNILKKDLQLSENNTTINVLQIEATNCKSALGSSQDSLKLVTDELKKANDRYNQFEADKEKTKAQADNAIKTLQEKVVKLQNDAVELKKKYAITHKSDKEILEVMKKDVNKTIDAVRAINILFGEQNGGGEK